VNVFMLELYYPGNTFPPAPRSVTLTATNYNTCTDCVVLSTDCDMTGANCAKDYLGQMGSLNITRQDISPPGLDGGVAGTGASLRLQEWDFVNDMAVANGQCVDVPSVTVDGQW
jgi:hypothetical protein